MTDNRDQHSPPGKPMVYQIRVSGHLGRDWSGWFEGLTVSPQANGDTLVTGSVADQAALHGLLKQVRDLGLPLLSVTHVKTGQSNAVAHWKEACP